MPGYVLYALLNHHPHSWRIPRSVTVRVRMETQVTKKEREKLTIQCKDGQLWQFYDPWTSTPKIPDPAWNSHSGLAQGFWELSTLDLACGSALSSVALPRPPSRWPFQAWVVSRKPPQHPEVHQM